MMLFCWGRTFATHQSVLSFTSRRRPTEGTFSLPLLQSVYLSVNVSILNLDLPFCLWRMYVESIYLSTYLLTYLL